MSPPELQVIVNANASGVDSVRSVIRDAREALAHAGARSAAVATRSLDELAAVIADAGDRRLVLVGGDGAVHAAANAGLGGEFALLPAGKANNIARALGLPRQWDPAAALAVRESARPLDLLAVQTGGHRTLAVEGVSAGFQAAARSRYTAENSADLRAGVAALLRALVRHRPYDAELVVDGEELSLRTSQLFVSNMRLFGYGFQVAPDALPDDGEADLVGLPPLSRARILPALAAVRRGAHLADERVLSRRVRRVELHSPLPLVADAEVLGTASATIEVVPGALRLARPHTPAPMQVARQAGAGLGAAALGQQRERSGHASAAPIAKPRTLPTSTSIQKCTPR
jgi:diacylglycerol kinase family enzyme